MKKNLKYFILLFLLLLLPGKIQAEEKSVSFSLKCYDKENKIVEKVNVNDTITCKLNIESEEEFTTVNIEPKLTNLELVETKFNNGWTLDNNGDNFSYITEEDAVKTFNLPILIVKATKAGDAKLELTTITINDEADFTASGSASYSLTVVNNCELGLKTLSIEDFKLTPDFDTNTVNYKAKVNKKDIKINATAVCETSSLSGTGAKTLEQGENTLKVTVTGEDNSKKIYTLTITYEPDKEKISTLDELKVAEADFNFKKDKLEYDIDVKEKVDKLTISYKTTSSKATALVVGNENLQEGENTVKVVVTAEDGSKTEYVLTVNIAKIDRSLLQDLVIEDEDENEIKLAPTFKEKTKTYTIKVPSDLETLNIKTTCKDDKCEITGDGSVDIKDKNTIEVKVKNGENETTYKINIKREAATTKEKSFPWLIVAIIVVLLLIGGGIATFIILKKKDKSKPKKTSYVPPKKVEQDESTENIVDEDSIIKDDYL